MILKRQPNVTLTLCGGEPAIALAAVALSEAVVVGAVIVGKLLILARDSVVQVEGVVSEIGKGITE